MPIAILERRAELEVRARKCSDPVVLPSNAVVSGRAPATTGLVLELAILIYNVAAFAKTPLQLWNEQGLFRLLFRLVYLLIAAFN